MNWYQAESAKKSVRQVVIEIPPGLEKDSKFGMLFLAGKYLALKTNTWGAGFFRLDGEPGPFFMVRADKLVNKLRGCPMKAAFCFYRMDAGGLVTVYFHADCPAVAKHLTYPIVLFEVAHGCDQDDTKSRIRDAISRDTLHICFADGDGVGINAQYDVVVPLPSECRAILKQELEAIFSYHSSVPSNRRDFERSGQQMWAENPQGDNPILARQSASSGSPAAMPNDETAYRKQLAEIERLLGVEHPDTLPILSHLAGLLYAKGDLAGAEQMSRRVLAGQERTLGSEHFATLGSLNNLAILLAAKGDTTGAEPLYRRALEVSERTLGPEHVATLRSLNNLALLLWNKGDLAAAEPLFRRALEARQRNLGSEHPDTVKSSSNLATLLKAKAKLASEEVPPSHPPAAVSPPPASNEAGRLKKAYISKILPIFPLNPQNLFHMGEAIANENLLNIAIIGQCICGEFEAWRDRVGPQQWPTFADRELAALKRSYERMHADVPFGIRHTVNTDEVKRLAKAYLECIQNDRTLYANFKDARLTVFYLSVDFANTIACGGSLQTILEWYK